MFDSDVIDACAIIVPWNEVPVPRVAELPTCQNTLSAVAPPVRTILLLAAVVSVLPIWKTYTPGPLSVRVPIRPIEDPLQYTPGVSVCPPRAEVMVVPHV